MNKFVLNLLVLLALGDISQEAALEERLSGGRAQSLHRMLAGTKKKRGNLMDNFKEDLIRTVRNMVKDQYFIPKIGFSKVSYIIKPFLNNLAQSLQTRNYAEATLSDITAILFQMKKLIEDVYIKRFSNEEIVSRGNNS